jgi:hypothetical protein
MPVILMQSEEGKTPSLPFLPPMQGDSNSSSVPVHSIFQITYKKVHHLKVLSSETDLAESGLI